MVLADEIKHTLPPIGRIALVWLGQAGYLIKDSAGVTVAVDLYLTDSCQKSAGLKRLSPFVISPGELKADILLATHDHPDHLDEDAVPEIMADPGCIFIGPKSTADKCRGWGIDPGRIREIKAGDSLSLKGVKISAVYADHGKLAPDAVGFLLEIGGKRIYITGDTAYRPDKIGTAVKFRPDIMILPINGAFGNLNSEEAAELSRDIGAKTVVPCHFWTFREHGGNPQEFYEKLADIAPGSTALFLRPGEIRLLGR